MNGKHVDDGNSGVKYKSLREDKNVKPIKLKTSQVATGQMTACDPLESRKQRG